jgi:endonuclease YncB( thermonuclease family)
VQRPDFSARPFDVLRVLEVHDGDSFRLLLDTGFEKCAFDWLRLKDYSCPELRVKDPETGMMRDNPAGVQARMATMALLHNFLPSLWVVTHKVPPNEAAKMAERYGETSKALTRYVAEVWLTDERRLGDELVAQGNAKPGARVG